MRLIVLDTETTGLSPEQGDKIVEIGAVEIVNRDLSKKRTYQQYINPQRPSSSGAFRVHGLTEERLQDEPLFAEIEEEFLSFIRGGVLVIHNAVFDLGFLMNELSDTGKKELESFMVIDSFKLAKSLFTSKNSLDALCDKFDVDRQHRSLHGALLDAELLAEVYLLMTGGTQFSLGLNSLEEPVSNYTLPFKSSAMLKERKETSNLTRRPPAKLRQADVSAHQAMMQRIHKESGGQTIWNLPERKKRAQSYVQQAEALLFVTGGTFDSKHGHSDLPLTKQFRDACPEYGKQDPKKAIHIQDEKMFFEYPNTAWSFYADFIVKAREAEADKTLQRWLALAKTKPEGYFAYTSNLDGRLQTAGWDEQRMVEAHGSLHHMQCVSDCDLGVVPNDIVFDIYMNELRTNIPKCPKCGSDMMPNVSKLNQKQFDSSRFDQQSARLQAWIDDLEARQKRLVLIEVGCNDAKVQAFSNQRSEPEFVRLVRNNMHYQYGRVPEGGLALNMPLDSCFDLLVGVR